MALSLLILGGTMVPASAEGLSVSAKSAVVVNADSGEVLWSKNPEEHLSMASTTKIMTALLTLEAAAEDDRVITITKEMVAVEGSSMGLQVGDQLHLSGLAAGMLSVSGNDAANSAAIALDGSTVKFAERMNRRAKELGLSNTHFVTPSGLDDDAHYSTALDMARLACAAMKNPAFKAIASQKSIQVEFLNPAVRRSYANHNRLLSMYNGCIGVKTGFTKKSGRCLVSAAERDGVRVVAVTLSAPDDWNDHAHLLDEGFSQLENQVLDDSAFTAEIPAAVAGGEDMTVQGQVGTSVVVKKGTELERTVELPRFLYAPVEQGAQVGRVCYRLNGELVGETQILANHALEAEPVAMSFWDKIREFWLSHFR